MSAQAAARANAEIRQSGGWADLRPNTRIVPAQQLRAARVDGPGDVDLLSAIVSGLAHQQVANDPGGDRWVLLARRVVEVLVADVDRRSARPMKKPATTRRVKK